MSAIDQQIAERIRLALQPWQERTVAAEAELAQALDILEHAFKNVRALTGGDERRMRAFLERHGRKL